jgi:hypothetical protein
LPSLPASADDLYDLPLEEFISARGALAKVLRSDGRRDEAKAVAALRKPSVAAWAVNQLVRTQKRGLTNLLEAGEALERAQSDLLEGRADRDALATALSAERDAVDALINRARGLLSGAGEELSAVTVDRIAATLHAAALDEEARSLVTGGRLERELKHVGLGGALGFAGGGKPGQSKSARAKDKPAPKRDLQQQLTTLRQTARAAQRALREVERELEQLKRRREKAAGSRDEARQALEHEQQRLRDAERAVDAQQQQHKQARAAAQAADKAVEKLSERKRSAPDGA